MRKGDAEASQGEPGRFELFDGAFNGAGADRQAIFAAFVVLHPTSVGPEKVAMVGETSPMAWVSNTVDGERKQVIRALR